MNETAAFWSALFADPEAAGGAAAVHLRALSRHGQPLLLMPRAPALALPTLRLYAPQTRRARLVRALVALAWQTRIPLWGRAVSLQIPVEGRLVNFLRHLAGSASPRIPPFGALAGNTRTEGYRFLVLVFDERRAPCAVVKAGRSPRAQELIRRERDFLENAPRNGRAGIPAVRARLDAPLIQAFALEPVAGRSPSRRDEAHLAALLTSWIIPDVTLPVPALEQWRELEQAGGVAALPPAARDGLRAARVHPVLCHGDFAPWNIRVERAGTWRVFDWERGRLAGLPAWDWFHYAVQTAILVERCPTVALVRRLERLLRSEDFQHYATRAGIASCAGELLLAYVAYALTVLRPAEGRADLQQLLVALRGGDAVPGEGQPHAA